jgi:hypothetical protein
MENRVNMVICVASLLAICAGVSCPDPCGGKRACPAGTVTGCNAGVCVCEPISN